MIATATIGWIGAGNLGKAIIKKFLISGYKVALYNRTKENVSRTIINENLKLLDSPFELFRSTNFVFLCLPNENAVNSVLFENKDYFKKLPEKNNIVINLGTFNSEFTKDLNFKFNQKNIEYLDCPVSGGVEGAESGCLTAMCSGNPLCYSAVIDLIRVFSSTIHYFPRIGAAQDIKVVNNLAEAINLLCAAEVLKLGIEYGFSLDELKSVLNSARGGSIYMSLLIDKLLKNSQSVDVSTEIRQKDLHLAEKMIDNKMLDLSLSRMVIDKFDELVHEVGLNKDQSICYDYLNSI